MKLRILFLSVVALFGLLANAQDNKPVLTVENFTGNVNSSVVNELRNKVIAAIPTRVKVVDINNQAALAAEKRRRESEDAMGDAGRVAEMTALMSNAIMKGNVDNLNVVRKEGHTLDKKPYIYYEATLTFSLSIVNAADGTIVAQQNFSESGTGDTEQLAVAAALKINAKPMERLINNAYKVEGKILAIDEQDAKKAKKVYINLGSNDGIQKGTKIEAFREVDIAGEKSKKLIGELTVEEVMSGSRALCKVNKGGDVILVEFGKGTVMPVRTKEQKAGFFDF